MAQLGRISGPLLEANLLRKGLVSSGWENLSFDTDLLYLDVINNRIGIKTSSPTADLEVNDTVKSLNVRVDTLITVPDFEIKSANNEIKSLFASLKFEDDVISDHTRAAEIDINENVISTLTPNTNLELRPNGNGTLEVHSDFNITGNLYTPYDITLSGKLVFGDSDEDSVTFVADIVNDILPSETDTYNIGRNTRFWRETYAANAIGKIVYAGGLSLGDGVNPALKVGKIWYVAENGLDTNVGSHQQGPYKTVKKALSSASNGDTVYIFPGTYEEDLPLVVPAGVTVTGADLRNTIITPDTDTQSNDVFLVNGETTISDLTIKNFYYDNINNTGHAFRFAPGFNVTSRSPYIQNCSVITHGSVTSLSDPLGFDSLDAGRGAYIDGSVATAISKEASMLFHSVTMITPGVDAVTMTNGVRVEWLNSFTYYAEKGLYAVNGTAGFANLATKFGAEIRSIGSANVYGTYGAVADGENTLMYLIQHNFGYIGSGKDSENDPSLRIQANETVELNAGRIYYQSMDHEGDFRVGDTFNVDFQTGLSSINGISVNAGGVSSINFGSPTSETNIDAGQVNTGNIRFLGNTVSSLSGPVNIKAFTGNIDLTQNVFVNKSVNVVGDFNLFGQLTLGNETSDNIDFNAPVQFDLRPNVNITYDLGSDNLNWRTVYIDNTLIDDSIRIINNVIETTVNNDDLILAASGTGFVVVEDSVVLDQNLTVNLTTSFSNTLVTDISLQHIGDTLRTGSIDQTGLIDLTGNLIVSNNAYFDNIAILDTEITTTDSNSNLELRTAGTGNVVVPNNDVEITGTLDVDSIFAPTMVITTRITTDKFIYGDLLIDDNVISTTLSNSDLELRTAGTGDVVVADNDVRFGQTLDVQGTTNYNDLTINGTLVHNGTKILTGNVTQIGNVDLSNDLTVNSQAYFENISIVDNRISTTVSNSNLELMAAGTGIVKVSTDDVLFEQNLQVLGITSTTDIFNIGTVLSNVFTTGDISADNNTITTSQTNSDLILEANGTGKVLIPSNNTIIDQNLDVNGLSTLKNTNIVGTLDLLGNKNQTGNILQTGNFSATNLTVTNDFFFDNIVISKNRIFTSDSNSDLELRAAGTGRIYIPSDLVRIDQTLSVGGLASTTVINNASSIVSDKFVTANIEINDNYITSLNNTNLVLTGAGFGGPRLEKLKFNTNVLSTESDNDNIILTPGLTSNLDLNTVTALRVPVGTTTNRSTLLTGDFRFNTTDSFFEGWTSAKRTFGGVYSATRTTFIRAHPTNNSIAFVTGGIAAMEVYEDKLRINGLTVDNHLNFNDNRISNLVNNDDILLDANGLGEVVLNQIGVFENTFTNLDTSPSDAISLASTGDGYIRFNVSTAIRIPSGDETTRPANPEIGDIRFNTVEEAAEVYNGEAYVPVTGTGDIATQEIVEELGETWILILG